MPCDLLGSLLPLCLAGGADAGRGYEAHHWQGRCEDDQQEGKEEAVA